MQTNLEELYSIFLRHRNITTDSRNIVPGSLFFALQGDHFDGNHYANAAIESGAAFAVIDKPEFENKKTLLVDNVLKTLQQMAIMHRRRYHIPVLAITGSNGKTTTKELITSVLSQQFKVTSTRGNLNNHIGVPLTLLEINDETELAIIEMGANHQGEIAMLCTLAEPTHGMITNIGKAHLEGFGGYEGVIKAKTEMYNWLRSTGGNVFVNAGNPLLVEKSSGMNRILYGSPTDAYCQGKLIENAEKLTFEWHRGNRMIPVETQIVGNYNFENAMAAVCIGMHFGVPDEKIVDAIKSYLPANSRSQAMATASNKIILDAYNANPTSMQAALTNFNKLNAENKMVILGDMLELGEESVTEHQAIADMVHQLSFQKALFIGPEFTKVAASRFQCFPNAGEALAWLQQHKTEGFTILVKGSRGIKTEKVLEAL